MKKNFTLLLIALLSMATGKALAYDAEIDGVYYNFNGDEAYVTNSEKYVGNSSKYVGKVIIPEQVTYEGKTYKVTTIMESAFYHSTNEFIGVELPNSLVTIGKQAFAYCDGLTEIVIPNSVKIIEEKAFYWCKGLQDIVMGNSVEILGEQCFSGCDGVTTLKLPNTVKQIGEYALPGSLTSFTIPSSITTITKKFLYGSGIKSIVIPEGVTTIESSAFNCVNLESVTLPSTLTSIDASAFSSFGKGLKVHVPSLEAWLKLPLATQDGLPTIETWTNRNPFRSVTNLVSNYYNLYVDGNLLEEVVIPESFTTVPAYAFYGCGGIKTVAMHNKVTSIEDGAFQYCKSLESVTISNSVTQIKQYAFQHDTIQSLTIGSGVLKIGKSAFGGNSTHGHDDSDENRSYIMKTIWLPNTAPTDYLIAAGNVNYVSSKQLYPFTKFGIPITNLQVYEYPQLSSMFTRDGIKYVVIDIPSLTCDAIDCVHDASAEVTKIGTTVGYNTSRTFNVLHVNPYTCNGNTYIKKVELGEGLPYIDDHVFDGCTNLTDIKLPSTVEFLGISAFQKCASLPEITLPAATQQVKHNAFKGCNSLKNVYMADGTLPLKLDANASVTINYQKQEISALGKQPMFEDCPLDYVYIGRNIVYDPGQINAYSPFYRNTSLRSVEIADLETEVSENEFYGCSGLKNVRIGDGVTTIDKRAFSGCSSLDYFEFGTQVKTIGEEAFSDCANVTRIISHATVPPVCASGALDDIQKTDFGGHPGCELYVPQGSMGAYSAAPQWDQFFLNMYEFDPTAVRTATADQLMKSSVFSLSGQRLAAPRKGINIINGRKVVVK